ncbi:MAG TPA: aldehyde dehydrogenase family protein [Candidatus Pygmaiobacter gallistercoris]|nr:aldehyde dehydrogenase family protein [Candidatus Pygmaiobacter gallistercoris]
MIQLEEILRDQRRYFNSGATLPLAARRAALRRLLNIISAREDAILRALQQDLGKPPMEGYLAEVSIVKGEIRTLMRHLDRWARARWVPVAPAHQPAGAFVRPEPYGVVLVQSPWNYPFQLCMVPLAAALAAGNCVIARPATDAPATAKVMKKLIRDAFSQELVCMLDPKEVGHADLLSQKYDYIFFTGSARVGRIVMTAAAARLTPVTLELGGKSPCIVDRTADLRLAARRIVYGKFLNAGQTCVAPDHLLVQREVKEPLLGELRRAITELYGPDPLNSPDLGHIINEKHFDRLVGLMEGQTVAAGGRWDRTRLTIEPTLLDAVSPDAPVMQEEIFGPILPILTFDHLDEVIARQQQLPAPLALYLFTRSAANCKKVIRQIRYGGGCVNDTVIHLANDRLPFGGVGESGMGSYHGRAGFAAFSHDKSVLLRPSLPDLPLRYPPYTKEGFALVRRFLK